MSREKFVPSAFRNALRLRHGVFLAVSVLSCSGVMAQSTLDGDAARGRALYMEGRLPDGSPLRARRADVPEMRGSAAACVQCHRRSGQGDQEGRLRVPPITAASLLAPGKSSSAGRVPRGVTVQPRRAEARPAYDAASLRHVLQTGLDPAGQAVDPWMPKYELSASDVRDLLAYLQQIGPVKPGPLRGTDADSVHLATIVTPDAPDRRREALLSTLPAWAKAQHFGPVGLKLHVWTLEGKPAQWGAQLQKYMAAQPVFAVISGAGAEEWAPVDAFCEAQALPCLFPMIDRVPALKDRYYSVHFSEGPVAEARVAVRALEQLKERPKRAVVWYDSAAGHDAAQVFKKHVQANKDEALPVVLVDWRDARAEASPMAAIRDSDLVMSWLTPGRAKTVFAEDPTRREGPAYFWLSGQLTSPELLDVKDTWRPRVRWVSLRSDTVRFNATAAMGMQPWLHSLGLPMSAASPVNGEIYAASFFFVDALQRARGQWSAEHVLERVEAGLNNRPPSGSYIRLSLAPGQRMAAQVGQIQGYSPEDQKTIIPLSGVLPANE